MKKILSVLLLIFIIFPVISVFADENFINKKNEYESNIESYLKSREDYLSAYNQYRSQCLKDEKTCEQFKPQALSKIRNYYKYSISSATSYLDLLKISIESSHGSDEEKEIFLKKIDNVILVFKDEENLIEDVNDSKKVKDFSYSLKTIWIDAEKQIILSRANIYFWKVKYYNQQLNDLAAGIEKYIIALSKDYDVNDLLEEYNEIKISLLDLNNSLDSIKKETENITKERYIKFKLSLTDYKRDKLQIINRYGQIINKLKEGNFTKISKTESGKLEIKGEGKIILDGSFEITGTLSDSKLSGEIEALISDNVDTNEIGEALKSGDSVLYKNVEGFSIKSKNKITINSGYLDITVIGKGRVSIAGYGLYKSDSTGSWLEIAKDKFEISI